MDPLPEHRPFSWSDLWRAGDILILLLGLMLLAASCSGRLSLVFLLPSATAFLLGVSRRSAAWFIPAGLLGGIALSVLLDELGWLAAHPQLAGSALHLIAQGMGWLSITGLTRRFSDHPHYWPLVPGGLLVLSGIAILASRLLVGFSAN